jgi:hypothetical protein
MTPDEKIMAAMARLTQITDTMRSSPERQAILEIVASVRNIFVALRNEWQTSVIPARPRKFGAVVGDEQHAIPRRRNTTPDVANHPAG